MAGRPSGNARQISQLVERPEDVGAGNCHRSSGITRILDGKFSVDAIAESENAGGPEAGGRHQSSSAAGSDGVTRLLERWKLGRRLSARSEERRVGKECR